MYFLAWFAFVKSQHFILNRDCLVQEAFCNGYGSQQFKKTFNSLVVV